ncbi:hypothetical protein T492DRAFT_504288 [Pavlovales sp. CCMP2436]|nr:hypothetical protein T492DRAFT_504288 [Pavlovales sp. CCMP2436]
MELDDEAPPPHDAGKEEEVEEADWPEVPPPKRACHRTSVFQAYNGEGELVFLTLSTEGRNARIKPKHGEMLATPIFLMRAQIEAEAAEAAAASEKASEREAAASSRNTPTPATKGAPSTPGSGKRASPSSQPGSQPGSISTSLWATKYAPRKFVQLVSSEQVNRSVLQWVKSWDPIVFGKKVLASHAMYIHIHIHIHTHTCTYTCTYTYTYTYKYTYA